MTFVVKKISNYGTGHPVVARLKVQTHDLLQWADLPQDKRDRVFALYFGMAERLLKCHEGLARLGSALNDAIKEMGPSSDQRVVRAPNVIGLKGEVETFLYEGKNYLRDLLAVINIFFSTNFDEASAFYDASGKRDGKLVKWATTKFGPSDPFTTMLISERGWVGELIRKRNSVEHPGGRSGTLRIENFEPSGDGRYIAPSWYRDQNPPTAIFTDLETYFGNLLSLAEDMLVSCIVHKTKFKIIRFIEVPEKDRNQACPVRITVTLDRTAIGAPIGSS